MVTIETLQQCRKAGKAIRAKEKEIASRKASAGCISGMRYGDTPHGRGEPIASQEAYVETLERLQSELEEKKRVRAPMRKEIKAACECLSKLQRELICGYYVHGYSWEEVNMMLGIQKGQSQYQVKNALKKILEKG